MMAGKSVPGRARESTLTARRQFSWLTRRSVGMRIASSRCAQENPGRSRSMFRKLWAVTRNGI